MSKRSRAALLLAFAAGCWSIAGVLTRQLDSASGFEITFWRSFFCAVTMLLILGWQQRGNPLAPLRAAGWAGLASGLMWGVMFTCFMLALTRTSVANTLLVMSIGPLLAALLGRAVLGTRLSTATWGAIVLAGLGIGWMVHEGVSADGLAGMSIALAVPVASAINIVMLKRLHASVDLGPAVLTGALLSCLITLPFAWPFTAGAHDLAILALLGAWQLAIPCVLMIRAVRHLASHEVALIALLEVVLGPIWAWLGADEAIPAATIQGGLIVLGALVGNELLAARSERGPAAQPLPPPTGPA
ncbi:MAG: DMT family transporter [Burkholderiales bacterium]|nr:DMT family transporter [Burkholderiales bacterium]